MKTKTLNRNERGDMTDELWVRHLKASDILDLQSLMVLLAGRDKEEREAAFKGILEIMNPVVVGVRSMEAIKPSVANKFWRDIQRAYDKAKGDGQ